MTPPSINALSLLILGLKEDTTPSLEEINKAYKRVSLVLHPDMTTGNSEMFRAIKLASEYLSENLPKPIPVVVKVEGPGVRAEDMCGYRIRATWRMVVAV